MYFYLFIYFVLLYLFNICIYLFCTFVFIYLISNSGVLYVFHHALALFVHYIPNEILASSLSLRAAHDCRAVGVATEVLLSYIVGLVAISGRCRPRVASQTSFARGALGGAIGKSHVVMKSNVCFLGLMLLSIHPSAVG